tara:strand:+ start:852011 stop:852424 length:414 start_codon:yes stop_codon:yes gene_type:complete
MYLWYFKPKMFEYFGEHTIYNLLGIKFYKRYLPTTGDLIRRWRKMKQIDLTKSDRVTQLYDYEKKTRTYEWRHIIGTLLFILLTFLIDRKLTLLDWILLAFLNLSINIYPIFLQRYNRIRILKVLEQNGFKSPYEKI